MHCSWCIAGGLHVHAEVDHVDEHLHVALGLHIASHYSEAKPGLAVLGHHRGDDRMERALVWLQTIQMILFERKECPAVLEGKSHIARYVLGAKSDVIALNERATVSILVDRAHIDGITARQPW